jgi:indolepyruvate decarboxylase
MAAKVPITQMAKKRPSYTVGNYLTDRLHEIGINHLFAIPGDYCADWIQKYIEHSPIERIGPTNELNAGYAADGYARLNGVGAVCVTYSVGALSLLNAVTGSYVEKVPVVVLNGAPSKAKRLEFNDTGLLFHHLVNGHQTDLNIYRNVTVEAVVLDNPDTAPGLIDVALRACLSESRPVYIEMDEEIYDMECDKPVGEIKAAKRYSDQGHLDNAFRDILGALIAADKPLLWIGSEVGRYGLQKEMIQFIKKANIPYITSLEGKAVIEENLDQFVGVFDGQSSPQEVQDAFNEADFVLAMGVWYIDINFLGEGQLPLERMAFASRDTVKMGVKEFAQVTIADLLHRLLDSVKQLPDYPMFTKPVYTPVELPPTARVTYQGLYDRLYSFLEPNNLLLGGTGFNFLAANPLPILVRGGYISQAAYTDIGYVTPAGTGAAIAAGKDHRVIIMAGDGGFQMTAQCISTQARLGLNPIIIIMNNGVYGIEQWLAGADVYKEGSKKPFFPLAVIAKWEYYKLAEVFGYNSKGWKVETYAELDKALAEAKNNTKGPSIIQVVVPSKSIPELAEWKVEAS